VFCFEKVGSRKPSPAFFQFILGDLGLDSRSVFMVGDDFENDVLGANANGISAVWLNRKTQEDCSGPRSKTISSPDTLVGALESLGFHRAG
jgi:FMN phosphatase YigB (HAD superfamily)